MRTKRLPLVSIPKPCDVSWDALSGTDTTRRCAQCDRAIQNLSAMTAAEAERFLAHSHGERLCVTYSRGPDGEVVTTDRPARFSFGRLATASTAAAATALTLSISTPAAPIPRHDAAYQGVQQRATSTSPPGGLRGTIRYFGTPSGQPDDPMPGVTITARDQNRGLTFTATSATDGTYELLLPRGRYDVLMNMTGFVKCQVDGIDIGSKVLVADAQLAVAPVGETFVVKEKIGSGCNNDKLDHLAHKK
jgi:hypothetical protein